MVQAMVEDAFRTQETGLGPAVRTGLLVIRRIDLGPIGSRRDQSLLNGRVAAALKSGRLTARRFDAIGSDMADAVLFPDPLAPHRCVLRAIAHGQPWPDSWPYRAVLGSALFAEAAHVAASVVADLAGQPGAAPAIAEALTLLGARRGRVLECLAMPHIEALTALFVSPAGIARPSRPLGEERADALAALRISKQSIETIRSLLENGDERRAMLIIAMSLSRAVNRPVTWEAVERVLKAAVASPGKTRAGSNSAESAAGPAARRYERDGEFGTSESAALERRRAATHEQSATEARAQALGPSHSQTVRTQSPKTPFEDAPREGLAAHPEPGAKERPQEDELTSVEPAATWPDSFPASRHSGAALLLVLIERAFGAWLRQPEHLETGTGQYLFANLLSRFRLEPDDPWQGLLEAFDLHDEARRDPAAGFFLPEEMVSALPGDLEISRVEGRPEWHLLTAASGRVSVALWQGRAPATVRRAFSGRALARAPARDCSLGSLLVSCELAMRVWLRRAARLRLRSLVHRPGRLQITRTHLDVIFDAGLVELAVRRHGLDLSPGWCAWLWRVVTIHYDFGERDA